MRNKIALPSDDKAFSSIQTLLSRYRAFTSLDDFLHYYFIGMSLLITPVDFEDLATVYLYPRTRRRRTIRILRTPPQHPRTPYSSPSLAFPAVPPPLVDLDSCTWGLLYCTVGIEIHFAKKMPPLSVLDARDSATSLSLIPHKV